MNYTSYEQEQNDSLSKTIKLSVLASLGFIAFVVIMTLVFGAFGTIGAGERGIKTRFSAVTGEILNEGLFFKMPWVEGVVKVDVKTQKEESEASAASKDLQTVSAKVAINYSIDPNAVARLYQDVGTEYKTRLIDPAVQESVKAATAQFTAEELITKREQVKENIKTALVTRLSPSGIQVEQFSIIDFDFSRSFNEAIEAKVTAEQNALAAKNNLSKVQYESEQRIAQARGEAEAIRLQSSAASSDNYIKLKALEVELKALEKWNGQLPQQMIPNATLPFVNLTK